MFWRRKQVNTETGSSSRVEYTPDQVADALLSQYGAVEMQPTLVQRQTLIRQQALDAQQDMESEHTAFEISEAPLLEPEGMAQTAPQPATETVATAEAGAVKPATPTEQAAEIDAQDEFYFDADEAPELSSPAVQDALNPEPPSDTPELLIAPATTPPLPFSNMDWPLTALQQVPLKPSSVAQALAPDWAASGLMLQESDALRLVRNVVLRVPLLLSNKEMQEFWVFVYPEINDEAHAHFVAVERKANLFGAVAVYVAPQELQLSGVQPATLPNELELSLKRWPAERPFPEGDYALWWPNAQKEHLSNSEEGRLLTRVFTLQDEAASLLYGMMAQQLEWESPAGMTQPEGMRRVLPEKTQYLHIMDSRGQPMILSAAQDKGVRLHLRHNPESEQIRRYWLEQTEQLLKILVKLLLSAHQPLDTVWHDYETRPSQWWKAAQQVLDLRLEIGDDLSSIQIGNIADEQQLDLENANTAG